jgi:hypothetical protein
MNSFSFVFGPLVALAGVAVLVLILRWAFSRGGSLVEKPTKPSTPDDYGTLVPVASPVNYADGERLRRSLDDAGIRATLAFTVEGPRLMVFPQDEAIARTTLRAR